MLELLGVERVPKRLLILGVFKVLKSYVGRSPLIQFCWFSGMSAGSGTVGRVIRQSLIYNLGLVQ
jgi:hypothetical protein